MGHHPAKNDIQLEALRQFTSAVCINVGYIGEVLVVGEVGSPKNVRLRLQVFGHRVGEESKCQAWIYALRASSIVKSLLCGKRTMQPDRSHARSFKYSSGLMFRPGQYSCWHSTVVVNTNFHLQVGFLWSYLFTARDRRITAAGRRGPADKRRCL